MNMEGTGSPGGPIGRDAAAGTMNPARCPRYGTADGNRYRWSWIVEWTCTVCEWMWWTTGRDEGTQR
jgi:hypothetical protein